MAIEAPGHVQGSFAIRQRHARDRAMAGGTSDALPDMDAVIEIHELRQRIHAHPRNRNVVSIAGANRLEHLGVCPDLRMAGHTGLGRRKTSKRRLFDGRMAVAAVDAELAHVMPVAEWDRLLNRKTPVAIPARQLNLIKSIG